MSLRLVAETVEQRTKRVYIIRRTGDVRAPVAAVPLIDLAIVVAHATGMNLHDQPVLQAHLRHLGQHLGAEQFLLLGVGVAAKHLTEKFRGLCSGQDRRFARWDARGRLPCSRASEIGREPCAARADSLATSRCLRRSARPVLQCSLRNPANSGSTTGSGRKLGRILAFHPDARMAL